MNWQKTAADAQIETAAAAMRRVVEGARCNVDAVEVPHATCPASATARVPVPSLVRVGAPKAPNKSRLLAAVCGAV